MPFVHVGTSAGSNMHGNHVPIETLHVILDNVTSNNATQFEHCPSTDWLGSASICIVSSAFALVIGLVAIYELYASVADLARRRWLERAKVKSD